MTTRPLGRTMTDNCLKLVACSEELDAQLSLVAKRLRLSALDQHRKRLLHEFRVEVVELCR